MLTQAEISRLVFDVNCDPYVFVMGCMNCERETAILVGDGVLAAMGSPICDDPSHISYVQARLWRADSSTGVMEWGSGAQYPLHGSMDEGRIVRLCLVAVKAFGEHEIGESFRFKGRKVYDPHMPVAILWEIADE